MKPASRQKAKSVFIHNSKAKHLSNNRVYFEQPPIEGVVTTREPGEEQCRRQTRGGRGWGPGTRGREAEEEKVREGELERGIEVARRERGTPTLTKCLCRTF